METIPLNSIENLWTGFFYDSDLRHERVNQNEVELTSQSFQSRFYTFKYLFKMINDKWG